MGILRAVDVTNVREDPLKVCAQVTAKHRASIFIGAEGDSIDWLCACAKGISIGASSSASGSGSWQGRIQATAWLQEDTTTPFFFQRGWNPGIEMLSEVFSESFYNCSNSTFS